MELTRLLDDPLPKGDLITKALHYLKNAWTSVMAYRNDGRYCIDNSIAERSICTLTIVRKNKMAFGSHKGAETSTVYHTFNLLWVPDEKTGKRLCAEIMRSGNFGMADERMKRYMKFISLSPSEVFWAPVWKLDHNYWRKINGYF